MKPHGLRDLSDKLMETARHHSYFNQAAEILHNMESHLCSMAALYEQQQTQHAPGHTDLMVPPETLEAWLKDNPLEQGGTMHPTTYDHLKPTDKQMDRMQAARDAAKLYGEALDALLPDGPDKTFVIRMHRQTAMWANVAIIRFQDGAPRGD